MDTQSQFKQVNTHPRHVHTLPGLVPLVSVNDRLVIQNKLLPHKKAVSEPEALPRMALAVYMAPTTITTSLPSPLAQTRMVDETLAYQFAFEIPYGQSMFELTWITNNVDKLELYCINCITGTYRKIKVISLKKKKKLSQYFIAVYCNTLPEKCI